MRPREAERLEVLFRELMRAEGHDALRSIAGLAAAEYGEQRRLAGRTIEAKVTAAR